LLEVIDTNNQLHRAFSAYGLLVLYHQLPGML